MHLDVVAKYFLPVVAGIEVNILETYSVLAQKGWDVTIHTSKDEYLKKGHLPNTDKIRGMKIKRYPFRWYGFFPEIKWDKEGIVALHNFDIFPHLHLLIAALFLKPIGLKKIKLVLTPHGGFNPEWSVFDPLSAFVKRAYTYSLGAWLIGAVVDAVRAVSEWEKAEMIRYGVSPSKITVISNGLEDEAFQDIDKLASRQIKYQVQKLGRYLIQIGRVYPIKNYETPIRALPSLPEDVKFVIVGPAEKNMNYQNSLIKLARDLGVGDRVIFLGVIRGVDKYYLIKHAQAMVHMAIWESFCNVVHEALSQKTPVLAANNTALPYLVKDGINGYLIDTFNHQTLTDKINIVLTKKPEFKFASFPTWSQTADEMHRLYSSLIKTHG